MIRAFHRLFTAILLTLLSMVLLFSAAMAYLIVTPTGGKLLVRFFKEQFVTFGLMHVGHYEGDLHNGFILKDITIKGLLYFPEALLRIQQIRVQASLWDVIHPKVDIFNARIFIPDSDPVVFTGGIYGGEIQGELYAKSLDVHETSRFFLPADINKGLQGYVSDVDFNIQGRYPSIRANGSFLADTISFRSILITGGISQIGLIISQRDNQFHIQGQALIVSGLVKVRNTLLHLDTSRFIFRGDPFDPDVDIHLGSKVEDMTVNLAIKGPSSNPQLQVSSDPPMAAQQALQVLFTGNAWSSSISPFSNGVSSSELAQDFLDYSLSDINDQDVGFKTKLTKNLKLGAEMDQEPTTPGEINTYYTHKINAEMDLNEHMSLNVSQEVMPEDNVSYTGDSAAQPEPETQVYMQYKKRF